MDRKSFEFVCATSVEPFPSPFNGSFRPLTSNCLLDLSWITDIYSIGIASCPIPKPACKDVICNTHGKPPDTPSQLEVFMIIYAPWISMDLYGSLAFHYSPVTLILPRTSATVAGCGLRIKCRQKLWGWCQFVQERRYSRLFAVAWSHLHSCSSHGCTWYRPAMWKFGTLFMSGFDGLAWLEPWKRGGLKPVACSFHHQIWFFDNFWNPWMQQADSLTQS